MLTRQEGERLAQSIHCLRPEWPVSSLLTTISKRKDRPMLDLALELMYVALDPDSKSPARIDVDGPWKRLNHRPVVTVEYREVTDDDCAICGRVAGLHSPLSNDPHEWEPQHARVKGVGPTPEQRAAIDQAAQDAAIALTAAKEAAVEREMRDPADVVASHLPEEKTA